MKQVLTKETYEQGMADMAKRVRAFHNWEQQPRIEVSIAPARTKRSIDQNSLFWEWMEELSAYFTKNGRPLSKDDAHDLMCHLFLGYDDKILGQQQIRKMRTTSRLGMTEFGEFMDRIDAWAADKGCYLPTPADSAHAAYTKRKRKHG